MKKIALVVIVAVVFMSCSKPTVIHEGVVKSVESRETSGNLLASGTRYDVVTFEDGFVVKIYGLESYQIGATYKVISSYWLGLQLKRVRGK